MSDSKAIRAKFESFATALNDAFVERETEIEILCTALVADEHVLFIGPPGEAKSSMLDNLVAWLNCKRFSVLLNGQSTLTDIFGPVMVSAFKNDRYERNIKGKLPEAECAFIDEPMRGNSAVRNAMLRIMNERHYEVGDGSFGQVPLRILVGGSNEWPKIEDEAEAFFDRFLFRKEVRRVASAKGMAQLLFDGDHVPRLTTSLSLAELDKARAEARAIPWSDSAKQALLDIVDGLHKDGITPSSRRLVKAKKAAQASAWLDGASEVDSEHLAVLAHVLWTDPAKEYRTKCEATVLKHANPSAAFIQARMAEAEQALAKFKPGDLPSAQVCISKLNDVMREIKSKKSSKAKTALDKLAAEIRRVKVTAVAEATS